MLKKIVKGYKDLLSSLFKILTLLVLCAACGTAVVLPLWKFATSLPQLYSITVLILLVIFLGFIAVRKIIKSGVRPALILLAKVFVIIAGLTLIFLLVTNGLRVLSLPVLVLMIFLYGLLSFSVKNHQKKELQNESEL